MPRPLIKYVSALVASPDPTVTENVFFQCLEDKDPESVFVVGVGVGDGEGEGEGDGDGDGEGGGGLVLPDREPDDRKTLFATSQCVPRYETLAGAVLK